MQYITKKILIPNNFKDLIILCKSAKKYCSNNITFSFSENEIELIMPFIYGNKTGSISYTFDKNGNIDCGCENIIQNFSYKQIWYVISSLLNINLSLENTYD